MTLLNTAKGLYVGSTPAKAAYAGSTKVWPPASGGDWTPFVDPQFVVGTNQGCTVAAMTLDKGWGVDHRYDGASAFSSTFSVAMISNGPNIDFSKPWGFQFWLWVPTTDSSVQWFMPVTRSTAKMATLNEQQDWTFMFEASGQNTPYAVGLQNANANTPMGNQIAASQLLGNLGWSGFVRGTGWNLITVEVGAIPSPGVWQNIRIRNEPDGSSPVELNIATPPALIEPINTAGSEGLGMMVGLTRFTPKVTRWVPVAWKGSLKP